ncbi:MAG: hypothetical protein Q9185_003046 [Variospora sp. 1 TL-2023]
MDLQATLPANKSTVAGSIPAAVTGADIIFTCLGDDAAMMETVDTICKSGTSIANKLFSIPTPPTAYSGRMIGGDYYRRAEPLFEELI